jgi:transcriptional regulator with XRE-family HTH domain
MADKIGITKSAYGYYEQGKTIPDVITARKIADILDVSVDYLLGNSDFKKAPELTPKDEKDIEKTLEQMVADLESGQEGPSFYGGNMELSEYDREVMRQSLSETLRLIKLRNKEKYTPKKYKEDLSNGSM